MILTKAKLSKNLIIDYISAAYMVFFGYTAFNKLLNLSSFQNNIFKTGLFPEFLVKPLSITVILAEIFVIVILIFNKMIGLLLLTIMMLSFTVYISFLNSRGQYELCGCGGVLNGLPYNYHLLINLVILTSSFFCYITLNQNHELQKK